MTNLFSTFNPTALFSLPLNWIALGLPLLLLVFSPWMMSSSIAILQNSIISSVNKELKYLINPFATSSILISALSMFWLIVSMNVLGLLPYVFTPSSHPGISLSLALPLWLGHMALSIFKQPLTCAAHLVPSGAPAALLPLLVMIETISSIIRPMTLTVRLTANMVAGHLILTLASSTAPTANPQTLMIIMTASIMLMVLESAVACIQAYVFSVLSTLYVEELNSAKMLIS